MSCRRTGPRPRRRAHRLPSAVLAFRPSTAIGLSGDVEIPQLIDTAPGLTSYCGLAMMLFSHARAASIAGHSSVMPTLVLAPN